MALELRDQLQQALGASYTLERELGGGGMSRVFVAIETSIGRRVVLKTLPPELAAAVNIDRFRREIQLAGKLQHPHIVPILASGIADGLPYYTMPLVEGESLRDAISHTGQLPIADVVRHLRGVLAALAYAHSHGVVHRDIKPDNVLLSGGYALVTDFGVAKALTNSTIGSGGGPVTSVGVALGTPAYMAPEQALADPAMDHRADLYALGAMAYEMLAGQPPFTASSPQALIAAHLTERPDPIEHRRTDVPAELATLVSRLLEKVADYRPESADEVLRALHALEPPGSGSGHPPSARSRRRLEARALARYAVAGFVAVGISWVAERWIGLPRWVVSGTVIISGLGLTILALSVLLQRQQARAHIAFSGRSPPRARLAAALASFLTWRRIAIGTATALSVFGIFVTGYMVLRAIGVGPSASLIAAGVLKDRGLVLIATFRGPASDTSLGAVVSDALRTDLQQSPVVRVMDPSAVRDALTRMQVPPATRVDLDVAREIAAREGISAIVDGDVSSIGGGFILSARLVAAQDGRVLAAFRETSKGGDAIIPAIDGLSDALRSKIGESIRSVNAAPALAQVTTRSVDALRKYTQGDRAFYFEGDFKTGVALLEQAVSIDTTFAMGYRKLASMYGNTGKSEAEVRTVLARAYALRGRLPLVERYLLEASYARDHTMRLGAYQAVLAIEPLNGILD